MIRIWSPALGATGLCLLCAGFLSYYVRASWDWFEYAAVAAGGVLVLAYLLLNMREIFAALTQRGALQSGNALLMALLVLAILGLANFLASKHTKRWDTTAAR